MHTEFYGLQQHPFQMTPDARLFFPSTGHRRAHAHLTYGLAQREGFIVVTGEVGAGKTTLIERLCDELDPQGFVIARITTTLVSGDDVLRMVADAFGADPEGNKAAVLRGIAAALRASRRRHLLIVDEAQGLLPPALEELRMLSNLTHPGQPPLQTILMGQPQLRRLLASPDLSQLRQRVLASYHLAGLTREETHAYVLHRLRAVGWTGRPSWDEAALDLVHHHTDGIPRRINRLCARVLLSGALEELEHFTAELVSMTALELEEDLGGPNACGRTTQASKPASPPAMPLPTEPPPVVSPDVPSPPPSSGPASDTGPQRVDAPAPRMNAAPSRPAPAPRVPPSRAAAPRSVPPRIPAVPPQPAPPPPASGPERGPQHNSSEAKPHAPDDEAGPSDGSQASPPASRRAVDATLTPAPDTAASTAPSPGLTSFGASSSTKPPLDGNWDGSLTATDTLRFGDTTALQPETQPPAPEGASGPVGAAVPEPPAQAAPEANAVAAPARQVASPDETAAPQTPSRTEEDHPDAAAAPPVAPSGDALPHRPDGQQPTMSPDPPRMLHTEALPHMDAELYDILTRPPPPPPFVPVRRRDNEPDRLFAWVFKLLPNNRSRR